MALQKLYTAANEAEAHLIRLDLEAEGLPVAIHGSLLGGICGDGTALGAFGPQVWVQEEDFEFARLLLESFFEQDHRDEAGGPWTCPGCRTEIESQFDLCWKCQTPRPEA